MDHAPEHIVVPNYTVLGGNVGFVNLLGVFHAQLLTVVLVNRLLKLDPLSPP